MVSLIIAVLWSGSIHAQSFSSGNEFISTDYDGEYVLSCSTQTTRVRCYGNGLSPVEMDYFIHPDAGNAAKVRLTSVYENGKSRDKTLKFDAKKGRTSNRVNLWIDTLVQRALLAMGENQITYEMLDKKKNVLEAGSFVVQVHSAPGLACPTRYYYSSNIDDCSGGGANRCNQYFNEVAAYCD